MKINIELNTIEELEELMGITDEIITGHTLIGNLTNLTDEEASNIVEKHEGKKSCIICNGELDDNVMFNSWYARDNHVEFEQLDYSCVECGFLNSQYTEIKVKE